MAIGYSGSFEQISDLNKKKTVSISRPIMDKLHETLLILQHFQNVIQSRTDFCKRNNDTVTNSSVPTMMIKFMRKGYPISSFNDEKVQEEISREVSDLSLILHNYIRLNIIDMYSFNDEYNGFFQEKITKNQNIIKRINTVKILNKRVRNQIDWDKLKKFRNISLAHNLRDKGNQNRLSVDNMRLLKNEFSTLDIGIKYSDIITTMFQNIQNEFSLELLEAEKTLSRILRNDDDL
jgi:hypothetical protein